MLVLVDHAAQAQAEEIAGNPTSEEKFLVNAILIDYFLYDTVKEKIALGEGAEPSMIPHHRTRSIWY